MLVRLMTEKERIIATKRRFQIWDYTPSLQCLVLVSNKCEALTIGGIRFDAVDTKLEVMFVGVSHLELPVYLSNLSVYVESLENRPGSPGDKQFILKHAAGSSRVIAADCVTDENGREYFEPSALLERTFGGSVPFRTSISKDPQ